MSQEKPGKEKCKRQPDVTAPDKIRVLHPLSVGAFLLINDIVTHQLSGTFKKLFAGRKKNENEEVTKIDFERKL